MSKIFTTSHWHLRAPKTMQLAAMFVLVCILFPIANAEAETRKLKLYFLHTGERAEITYKKNGRYISSGLKKINRFLRDWRRNEPTKMDPRLLDLVWEVHKETGSRKHIHVISGYRSPKTNSLLRKRGRGVAKKSQHTLGKALDFFIPGVKLSKLRAIALRKGLGGVGYYPRSGSPFVHMDTGRVRHWPRMSRKELVRVFPRGKTLHVPTDGKPLPGYNQAKADYERKLKGKGRISIASAEEIKRKPGLLSRIFRRDDDNEEEAAVAKPAAPVAATPKPATPKPVVPKPEVPAPQAAPTPPAPIPTGETDTSDNPELVIAALLPSQLPVPQFSPRFEAAAAQVQNTQVGVETETQTNELLVQEPAIGDAEEQETETTELALNIPVPTQNPNLSASTITLAENSDTNIEIPSPTPRVKPIVEQTITVAALSPAEIEDMRNEIYASDAPIQNQNPDEIKLLTALNDNSANSNLASASTAINQQLTQQPVKETVALDVPVPSQNPANAKRTQSVIVSQVAAAESQDQPKKKAENTVKIQERMIGQWAFATDNSIETISKIEPITARQNAARSLPSSVESSGFSISNENISSDSFSGVTN